MTPTPELRALLSAALTLEPHGDGYAVYSGRVQGDYDPGDGSFFAGSHGNRLFNVTDATEAGLNVLRQHLAAVNSLPALLDRVEALEAALQDIERMELIAERTESDQFYNDAITECRKLARAALKEQTP